ncbi:hypothetical protein G7Y89_g4573 [Cudoniella acicularis]|uniref:Uncharacterized protein n=1 Tax=Cudoniella acicularis TaxID=354080 RepID=A0A8H4W4K1_9HELO|nr:hypothetical protein G7Y89_g4573 [Cudoniella acicularis]
MSDMAVNGSASDCHDPTSRQADEISNNERVSQTAALEAYTRTDESHEVVALGYGNADSEKAILCHTKEMKDKIKETSKILL